MSATSDAGARRNAVDPSQNVVLEASAGTGKTRVLVDRYVNLLLAGVDPDHILAITFTRKAAAEMRQRIVQRLKDIGGRESHVTAPGLPTLTLDAARWRDLRGRLGDIAISTIDAFCLSLLREFPLEADVDPGFNLADETEVPRLVEEALDQALRICRARAREDDDIALVFAQLGERRIRAGLTALLDRRLVAPAVLRRFLAAGPKDLTAARACGGAAERLRAALGGPGFGGRGVEPFLEDGPVGHPHFAMLAADIRQLCAEGPGLTTKPELAAFRVLIDRLRAYFLTQQSEPRKAGFAGTGFTAADCASPAGWKRHREQAVAMAPAVADTVRGFRRDLNVVMSRGVWRMFAVALSAYERTLDARALVDFQGVLARALDLLRQMDEFARSRYRLEARYHHVLVDEFQDTSRAQWELVAQLVRSWGEGLGAAADALPPSIFIVGDRKQSIYGFRDAEVAVFDDATRFVEGLRPDGEPRQAISVSFRAVPALLGFVNDVFGEIDRVEGRQTSLRRDRFRFETADRFPPTETTGSPVSLGSPGSDAGRIEADAEPAVGLVVGETVAEAAGAVAGEVIRLLSSATIRDRRTGVRRGAKPADVAILFRSRDSHREFEAALARRGVPTYVYKGLGFFDADEIQDIVAVLRFLADPGSDLRAAAFLRSRLIRLSDDGLARLAPHVAAAITGEPADEMLAALSVEDRAVLARTRSAVARWLTWVDRTTPAELLDAVLRETAFAYEWRGARRLQSRENVKKLRGLIRRAQNRGYATLARIADHLDRLAVGDESNAAIDAVEAVSLMTVHAAKGLEFPIVFVVNIGRGAGGVRAPIRVVDDAAGEASVAIADYQSEADADMQAREREEIKRLLYVALTRARDRLYLSATVAAGACRMGPGSLGSVLPRSLAAALAAAATDGPVTWDPESGTRHVLAGRRLE